MNEKLIENLNQLEGENPEYRLAETPDEKIISYHLWDEFYHKMKSFIGHLEFLVESGFVTEKTDISLAIIEDYVQRAGKTTDEYFEMAKEETRGQVVAVE